MLRTSRPDHTDQLSRIEASASRAEDRLGAVTATLARLEAAVGDLARAIGEHGGQLEALRLSVAAVKSMVPPGPPSMPAGTSPAAGGEQEGEPAAARRARKTLQPPQDKM